MFAKGYLAGHFAFDEIGHILWVAKKLVIVMTDKRALTRFFEQNTVHHHFCDQTLMFNFILTRIQAFKNPAAYYVSRLEDRPEGMGPLEIQ